MTTNHLALFVPKRHFSLRKGPFWIPKVRFWLIKQPLVFNRALRYRMGLFGSKRAFLLWKDSGFERALFTPKSLSVFKSSLLSPNQLFRPVLLFLAPMENFWLQKGLFRLQKGSFWLWKYFFRTHRTIFGLKWARFFIRKGVSLLKIKDGPFPASKRPFQLQMASFWLQKVLFVSERAFVCLESALGLQIDLLFLQKTL